MSTFENYALGGVEGKGKLMKDKPIPFKGEMVRAILAGIKTNTRRVIKPQPTPDPTRFEFWPVGIGRVSEPCWVPTSNSGKVGIFEPQFFKCPYAIGQRLWVKEAWRTEKSLDPNNAKEIAEKCEEANYRQTWAPIQYEADGARRDWIADFGTGEPGRYRHARFMPRWAARLHLEITDIRVERLNEISEADAIAEGIEFLNGRFTFNGGLHESRTGTEAFGALWESIHGSNSFDGRWVWCLTFKRVEE